MSICLHDVVHRAATAFGTRPRPVAPFSAELEPVPVRVALMRPGESEPYATVPVEALWLHVNGGSECVLFVTLPPEVARDAAADRGGDGPAGGGAVPGAADADARPAAGGAPDGPPQGAAFDGSTPMLNTVAGRRSPAPPNSGGES